jgi:hypothetical protein
MRRMPKRRSLSRLDQALLTVTGRAARLGLVAPFVVREWDEWFAQTEVGRARAGTLARICLSSLLNSRRGRETVAANYGEPASRCTPESLLAHELGHAFQDHWKGQRRFAPIKGYRQVFDGPVRFTDPWNQLLEYQQQHPNAKYDRQRYLSWYAWSDPEEDFAETFAEVVLRAGRIEAFRRRPGVCRKMRFLLDAGRRILHANPVLRRCNEKGTRYLFGGHEWFVCPDGKGVYGVPLIEGRYVCPCGVAVVYDGTNIEHG